MLLRYQVRPHLIPMSGTDVAYTPLWLIGLSVREEADLSGSYSVKPRLEGVDGRRVDDFLWETIPAVSYTFGEEMAP